MASEKIKDVNQRYFDFARAVARHLPGKWTYNKIKSEPPASDDDRPYLRRETFIQEATGAIPKMLRLCPDWQDHERIGIIGLLPSDPAVNSAMGQRPDHRGSSKARITVGLYRSPKQVANDIARRLLPGYTQEYTDTAQRLAAEAIALQTSRIHAQAVARICPELSDYNAGRSKPASLQGGRRYHTRFCQFEYYNSFQGQGKKPFTAIRLDCMTPENFVRLLGFLATLETERLKTDQPAQQTSH